MILLTCVLAGPFVILAFACLGLVALAPFGGSK